MPRSLRRRTLGPEYCGASSRGGGAEAEHGACDGFGGAGPPFAADASARPRCGLRPVAVALLAPVAAAIVAATACSPAQGPPDPEARTWIRNMWTGPAVLPQAEARPLPEGSIAVGAPRIMNRREARLGLTNPLEATAAVTAEGEALYATYCALCHGEAGTGDGELASFYRRMPDLTAPHVLNYPEGFVYAIIREGGRNMPRLGDALSARERWALVHYLRTLGPPDPAPEADSR